MFEWSFSRACFPIGQLGTPMKAPDTAKKVVGNSHFPTLTMDQCAILWITPSPIAPGKSSFSGICNGISPWDGWVTLCPWVRGTYSVSLGFHCPSEIFICWNAPCLEWNMQHWEKGEYGGPGLAYHDLSLSSHDWQCCLPWLPVWYVQPAQVLKAANHPLLKARQAHSVFPRCNHWPLSLFPILAWRTIQHAYKALLNCSANLELYQQGPF